jgi:hypothetical protein
VPGYARFLDAMADPQHPEHKELKDWIGRHFDPAHFSPAQVRFDDPQKRWDIAFQ